MGPLVVQVPPTTATMGQWVVGAQATPAVNHARGIPWNDSIITAFMGPLVVQVPPTSDTSGVFV